MNLSKTKALNSVKSKPTNSVKTISGSKRSAIAQNYQLKVGPLSFLDREIDQIEYIYQRGDYSQVDQRFKNFKDFDKKINYNRDRDRAIDKNYVNFQITQESSQNEDLGLFLGPDPDLCDCGRIVRGRCNCQREMTKEELDYFFERYCSDD